MVHFLFGLSAMCALFFGITAHADSNTIMVVPLDKTREIFEEAAALSGYKIPTVLPKIHVYPHERFFKEICAGEFPCSVAYSTPGKPILVDNKMDVEDTDDYSFYVHEAIHMLQYEAKHITNLEALPCKQGLEFEKEAYHLQQKFLSTHGRLLRVTWMIDRASCPD